MTSLNEAVWFAGPVQDAIALVSHRNCVFLVYIYDDSEKTNTLNATLNEQNVVEVIGLEAIALAMKKDSENATMFGQFYPIQTVPILYFIKQGTIRDFAIETITGQEVIDKVRAINQVNTPIIPETQPAPVAPATTLPQLNQDETVPSSSQSNDTNTNTSKSVEEEEEEKKAKEAKKQEMQKQLEKVRKERAEREQKEAKEREIKRREDAKQLQEARQYQENRENKIYFDKIKKERREDEEHRKRVREQIARDRAEKIAQRNAEKQRRDSSISSVQTSSTTGSPKSYDYSNLNIRQLDGSNIRHQFEGSATLSAVKAWIEENRTEDNKASYKLSSQFPTRVFTETDDSTTLKDLNLCPSATMIMKPIKASQTSSNHTGVVGSVQSIYNSIYAFFAGLFVMFNNFLTALFPTNGIANFEPSQQPQQQQQKNLGGGQRLGGEGIGSSSSASSSNNNVQRRNPYATRVNTLHDDDSEDEDDKDKKRPTYNGNSVNHE